MEYSFFERNWKKMLLGFIAFILLVSSCGTVDAGERGVRTRLGSVRGVIENGFYMKLPFIEHVKKINVQIQKEQAEAQAASSDLQTVNATVALNYNVIPENAADLYLRIGTDYKTRIIDPAIQEAVKAATAKHTAEELITKRELVRDEMKEALTVRLATDFIKVSEVSIVNFDFSPSFNQAIEAKVTAEQNALASKNKLEQVKYEAEQQVVTAQATAESQRIQSASLAAQGGEDYVNLKAIEKWNGVLPSQMIPGSTVPFINLN